MHTKICIRTKPPLLCHCFKKRLKFPHTQEGYYSACHVTKQSVNLHLNLPEIHVLATERLRVYLDAHVCIIAVVKKKT